MKKIGIDVDTIRDWYSSLISTYIKQIDDFEGDITEVEPKDLWEHFKFPKYVEIIKEVDDDGNKFEDGIVESTIEQDLEGEYEINQQYFNQFLLDNVLEIFGHAKERENNIISFLNEVQRNSKDLQFTLFTRTKGKAKPATLFFLSKYGCEIDNIMFLGDDILSTDLFDHLLTKEYIKNINSIKELDFKNL